MHSTNSNTGVLQQDSSTLTTADTSIAAESGNSAAHGITGEPRMQFDLPAGCMVRVVTGSTELRSVEEINNTTKAQRQHMSHLTVIHPEIGEIFWPGQLDTTEDVSLSDIIHFESRGGDKRSVDVYPDENCKPPVGQGLNRPAIITFFNMFPTNKTTKEPIKTESALERYAERLRRSNKRSGAEFLSYGDQQPGDWRFRVLHFSKYGLLDSDDEDDDDDNMGDGTAKGGTKGVPKDGSKPSGGTAVPKTSSDMGMGGKQSSDTGAFEEEFAVDDDEEDSHDQDADDTDSVDMQTVDDDAGGKVMPFKPSVAPAAAEDTILRAADLVDDDDDDQDNDHVSLPVTTTQRLVETLGLSDTPWKHSWQSPADMNVDVSRPYISEDMDWSVYKDGGGDAMQTPYFYEQQKLLGKRAFAVSTPSVTVSTPRRTQHTPRVHLVPAAAKKEAIHVTSLEEGKHGLFLDSGLALGRSFRVGWGPNGTLVFPTKGRGVGGSSVTIRKVAATVAPFADGGGADEGSSGASRGRDTLGLHRDAVHVHMSNSVVEPPNTNDAVPCPFARMDTTVAAVLATKTHVHNLTRTLARASEEPTSSAAVRTMLQENMVVWRLVDALWGVPSIPLVAGQESDVTEALSELQSKNTYDTAVFRRRYVSDWLKQDATRPLVKHVRTADPENPDSETTLLDIFNQLSLGNIPLACAIAREAKDYKLALMIAQSPGGTSIRRYMREQLSIWMQNGSYQHININRLKIFALLGGSMAWPPPGDDLRFSVCAHLDWKRAYALHLWYYCDPSASVSDAVVAFDDACNTEIDVSVATLSGGFEKGTCIAQPPTPPYLQTTSTASTPSSTNATPKDISYHLLKLYMDASHSIQQMLLPASITDCPVDYRLSWLLYTTLRAVGMPSLPRRRDEQLHIDYASQLEAAGLWHLAAFVLLHIENAHMRTWAVKELLLRNVVVDYATNAAFVEKAAFVTDQLCIPPVWLHSAIAVSCKHLHVWVVGSRA